MIAHRNDPMKTKLDLMLRVKVIWCETIAWRLVWCANIRGSSIPHMFETRNSSSGIDAPHPITSLSSSFPSFSLGWSQSSHKSPLARRLKVLRTSCLEDRWVESQLKRWTFVSLQYVSVTDSTTSSFLPFYFILHTIMQNRRFLDAF